MTEFANIRNGRDDITDPIYIKRVRREYYEQLYANQFDNLDEMKKFSKDMNYQAYSRRYR